MTVALCGVLTVLVIEQDCEIVIEVVVTTESSAWATGRLKKSIEKK